MQNPNISYAQNREDILLSGFFDQSKTTGFYVDVGANHPVHESVTKFFYDKGWSGINIEPTDRLFRLLELTRPRDINLQVGVSDKKGELLFREYVEGDGLSTFSNDMQAEYEKSDYHFARKYVEYQVEVRTLAEIFADTKPSEIDFMKVDVEGFEYEVLQGNDWNKYRPKVLCIEANHIVKDWHDLIYGARYKLAFFDGLNEYFVAEEEAERLKSFSYPDTMLLGVPFTARHEFLNRQDTERKIKRLAYENNQLKRSKDDCGNQVTSSMASRSNQFKAKIRRLDERITQELTSKKTDKPIDTNKDILSLDEIVDELKLQLAATIAHARPVSAFAHTKYVSTKSIIKRAVRKVR